MKCGDHCNDADTLKKKVFQANMDLVRYGLVTLTWGNVSGIDRSDAVHGYQAQRRRI